MKHSNSTLMAAMLIAATSNTACAFDHDDLLHLAAHGGTSFALQTFFYGFNHQELGLDSFPAETMALVETLALGLAYKTMLESSQTEDILRATGENALGAGLAIGTQIAFHF